MLFEESSSVERRRRIRVAAWAYAYEVMNESLVSDHVFDAECLKVDLSVSTGDKKMDAWFKKHFDPSTGMWVRNHPDQAGLARICKIMKRTPIMENEFKFSIGQQKLLAEQLSADMEAHCVEKYGSEGPRWHLGASVIGKPCPRQLWYSFRWVKDVKFTGRMYRLFNRGHKEEFRFVEWLRGMGHEVWEFDENGKQFRISDVRGHFGGSCDGMIKLGGKYAALPKMLLEFKTSSAKYFEKMKKDGVRYAKPEHFAQMCTYGQRLKLRYALYMTVNKDTDEIYFEIVELQESHADDMTTKAQRIIDSPVPPPKLSENSAYFECKFCDFAPVCHGQVQYDKNCRSCTNAVAAEGGEWFCKLYAQAIPREFVPQGCPSWAEAR